MLGPSSKSMKNTKTGEEIYVFEDEDANWCVIVGTNDIKKAEKALRETEIEWYGENHEEEPLLIDDFYPATIFYGKQKNMSTLQYVKPTDEQLAEMQMFRDKFEALFNELKPLK